MSYFVTGGTGFIGGHLLERLVKRKGTIYLLLRKQSASKLDELRERLGVNARRLIPVYGDLSKPMFGLRRDAVAKLSGKIKHYFHLAAYYDLMHEDEERERAVNVEGTRHAVAFAVAIKAGCFHHMSSIAVAGNYRGYWREDMYAEAESLPSPYFRAKHEAEGVVRNSCTVPWRVYRPGIVVGDSKTGESSKADGPYYFFKFLQRIRKVVPPWMPIVGLEGGRINIVPVDYVADSVDYIAHKRGLNKKTFHIIDPKPYRAGEALNIFAAAAHGPQFAMRIDSRMLEFIPRGMLDGVAELPPIRRIIDNIVKDIGIPKEGLRYLTNPTRFDCRDMLEALKGSGIECPSLDTYAPTIWDYWERHLDPDLFRDHTLAGAVRDKVVVITGASSGIGRATALVVGAAGAITVLASRTGEKLDQVKAEIEAKGGRAFAYEADISKMENCDHLIDTILKNHGQIDVLVNNAGKSIRRSIQQSYDRFHDFERLMQVNYFGAIRLIMKVLPSMAERRSGHIVNVSTIGVLANSPRFSAYVASKSALDAFSRCVAAEFLDKNVQFTTINMPLVRTPMINPTGFYDHVPALTAEDAANLVCEGIIDRPKRIATRLGIFAQVMTTLFPNFADVILNTAYKLFPDTPPAGKEATEKTEPSTEAMAFAAILRGIYW